MGVSREGHILRRMSDAADTRKEMERKTGNQVDRLMLFRDTKRVNIDVENIMDRWKSIMEIQNYSSTLRWLENPEKKKKTSRVSICLAFVSHKAMLSSTL